MESLNFPILSAVVYIPTIGALLMALFIPGRNLKAIRWFALGVAIVDLLVSFAILPFFNAGTADFQLLERTTWIPSIGVQYLMGVDGISLLLVLLTTVLGVLAILSSFSSITDRVKEYMICLLVLQTGMLGVFFALDIVLFYVFWEVMLIPMALLIGIWGGQRRIYAAVKFFLFTLVGSLFMLIGFLVLYFSHQSLTGTYTFEIIRFMDFNFPAGVQAWAFWALFLGFAIKVPMFPFHTWLPDAHVEAPTAGSVILAGVLLKMGTYGFIRFSLPMLPEASLKAIPLIATLSVIGIIYGALVAWAQTDVKKLVAYSSVSHLGFVMLGLFTVTFQGLQGGVLQMINHGLSTGALFLLVGILYERRHTRMINAFGGLAAQIPLFTVVFGIVTFSSIGLPGLNGFIGEFLILLGSYQARMWIFGALAATGVILSAIYMLSMFRRVMYGKLDKEENKNLPDLNTRELFTLVPLVVLIFWIGLYPKPFLNVLEAPIERVMDRLESAKVAAAETPLEDAGIQLAMKVDGFSKSHQPAPHGAPKSMIGNASH